MSAPKIIIQILVTGAQIFGKALFEAGKQAAKNAKHTPQGVAGSDIAGVRNATSGSLTDKLTREHRMTLDEAHLILNLKQGETLENVLKNYEHLLKVNGPRPAPAPPTTGTRAGKQPAPPTHSHYLQSKVVRARERIEAEMRVVKEEDLMPPSGSAQGNAGGPS
ncbi:protein transporter [Suillus subaureus]|uniref:Mitochondrial import inner membrane translocase subunit TIM16 n=1 Tax=Suillus subaureus TaxID=48587 RepID=A0A9P7JDG2_9AGAM|nr:protein transporter [Suillus subaureus]KAG1816147.1 protein transporter [Suillus subaureus]